MIADPRETGSAGRVVGWSWPRVLEPVPARQIRPPCPSMTRRASGSARPIPPRFSSNTPRSRVVCRLYGGSFADDHDGGALAVIGFAPPLGDHHARAAFFTQNRPENGVERGPKPCGVAGHRAPRRPRLGLPVEPRDPWLPAHVPPRQRRGRRCPPADAPACDGPAVELRHVTHFGDQARPGGRTISRPRRSSSAGDRSVPQPRRAAACANSRRRRSPAS